MSGSGIRWDICKSAPRSRQTTTPVPHHSVFYRPDALPAAQPTASKHWRPKHLHRWYLHLPHLITALHFLRCADFLQSLAQNVIRQRLKSELGATRRDRLNDTTDVVTDQTETCRLRLPLHRPSQRSLHTHPAVPCRDNHTTHTAHSKQNNLQQLQYRQQKAILLSLIFPIHTMGPAGDAPKLPFSPKEIWPPPNTPFHGPMKVNSHPKWQLTCFSLFSKAHGYDQHINRNTDHATSVERPHLMLSAGRQEGHPACKKLASAQWCLDRSNPGCQMVVSSAMREIDHQSQLPFISPLVQDVCRCREWLSNIFNPIQFNVLLKPPMMLSYSNNATIHTHIVEILHGVW